DTRLVSDWSSDVCSSDLKISVQFLIENHLCRSLILERLRVPTLMVIDRVRVGHQNRGLAECCQFGHRGGASPTKHQVGAGVRLVHFLDKRKDLRFERKRIINLFEGGKVCLSRLVNDLQSSTEIR